MTSSMIVVNFCPSVMASVNLILVPKEAINGDHKESFSPYQVDQKVIPPVELEATFHEAARNFITLRYRYRRQLQIRHLLTPCRWNPQQKHRVIQNYTHAEYAVIFVAEPCSKLGVIFVFNRSKAVGYRICGDGHFYLRELESAQKRRAQSAERTVAQIGADALR